MRTTEQIMQEVMAISDPQRALLRIATDKETDLWEKEKIFRAYLKRHEVNTDEMAFYPNGEKVLKPELLWGNESSERNGMSIFEIRLKEALAIKDPRLAGIKIFTDEALSVNEMEKIQSAYLKKYGTEAEEMAFYPNGERVLTLEVFRYFLRNTKNQQE